MHLAMNNLDLLILAASIVAVLAVGLWMGREERGTEDYFLAGRKAPWYVVAGSIFGTNVSAEHLIGMLGIGYSVGFAQSHFELGAIFGLMLLCYGFLPLYRRMRVYTLSEYLERRYDDRSRLLYALITLVLITFVQMVGLFYIGARSMRFVLQGTPVEISYQAGLVVMAAVTCGYTVLGGLKAVVWTDLVQSALLLAAGITLAAFVYHQPEVGGLWGLIRSDAQLPPDQQRFHLYLPSDHPLLPWSGVFTGLMILHFFYWGTNQFMVQRALAARSALEGRIGVVTAGYFKLLIPFMSIGAGIAAARVFDAQIAAGVRSTRPLPDDAFPALMAAVVPAGYGLVGLIVAGVLGAIMSTIDSMLNAAATLFTFDIYRRHIRPGAPDRELLRVGRATILVLTVVAATLAWIFFSEDQDQNFFLTLASRNGHLVPGLLVSFALGVFWPGATARGSFLAIVAAPAISVSLEYGYRHWLAPDPRIAAWWGTELNFLHRTALTALLAATVLVVVSLLSQHTRSADKERYTWWVYRHDPHEPARSFWQSERPLAVLLVGLALGMLVCFR